MLAVVEEPVLSPWHDGEIRLQQRAGVADRMSATGRRSIRDHLIEQHQKFYPQLPFIVMGAVDPDGDVWATVRAQRPGFLGAPDPYHLAVDLRRDLADPADRGMDDGNAIALLGIELHTRRRNRLNGTIHRDNSDGFSVGVEQSYGNCPQYIQVRDYRFVRDPSTPSAQAAIPLDRFEGAAATLVQRADTFFVASYADAGGHRQVDVSHRGGRPGFVRMGADGMLTIPDFAGNLFFNTLGNFLVNPRAGLVFVDFDTGDMLQMTGDAEVVLDSPEIGAFQGAERLWRFRPRRIILRRNALPLRWTFSGGWSPNAMLTGDWETAAERIRAAEKAAEWRRFRIAAITPESASVRSFMLEPTDGVGIVPHRAGQHLPIRVSIPDAAAPGGTVAVQRSYTLSLAPSDGRYRISVKRDGQVSRYLHGLRPGDTIKVRAPLGDFTIDAAEQRPAVMLAGGIGITPMLAMLRHLVYEGARTRRMRPTWLLYAAHDKGERAFDAELAALMAQAQGAVRLIRFLSETGDAGSDDYDRAGRIDMAALTAVLPFNDYDFYLCGPSGFMQSLYDGLRRLNVADDRIRAEAFGPAGLRRQNESASADAVTAAATQPVLVTFTGTGKTAEWMPGSGTLLELAERAGLQPAFSCRSGSCGSCRTRVEAGAVAYLQPPTAAVAPGEALICCSVPAQDEAAELSLLL